MVKIDTGRDQPLEEYIITYVKDSPCWGEIPTLQIDQILWMPDAGVRAEGQLCTDGEYLYVHMRAVEEEIRAEFTEPLSPVCQDSCLEFFFKLASEECYFNFEINPNGCLVSQFGRSGPDRFYFVRENEREYFDIHTNRTSDGWEVFYRIPRAFIGMFYPGYRFEGVLMANMYKCGNLTRRKHFLSWAPVHSEVPNFHRPEDFRVMRFEY